MAKFNKAKGFTLIELLVVIAIIGLLSTLAVIYVGSSRSKARDARRLSDLRNMQSSIELYRTSNNDTLPVIDSATTWLGAASDTVSTYLGGTMSPVDTDPTNVSPYYYTLCSTTTSNGQKYIITSQLENLPPAQVQSGTTTIYMDTDCVTSIDTHFLPPTACGGTFFCLGNL